MSLLTSIIITFVGIFIIGLGIAIQKNGFNIMGILALLVGAALAILPAFLAA
ncbi:hypothetical protein V7O62_05745 [Methanolobus sp. ZRKC2]|uniref:hypothetical protein n=1 Tax=Methanolobus sp. ZRKC2 TaxID=3125783 RepID=UPI00324FE762